MSEHAVAPQPSIDILRPAVAWASVGATFPALVLGPAYIVIFPTAFAIALAHAVVLGLPAYFLLLRRFTLHLSNATVAGLLIGALPATIIACLTLLESDIGWGVLFLSLLFGLCGALGGYMFARTIEKKQRF